MEKLPNQGQRWCGADNDILRLENHEIFDGVLEIEIFEVGMLGLSITIPYRDTMDIVVRMHWERLTTRWKLRKVILKNVLRLKILLHISG